jgi:hypothetical protein
VPVTLIPYVLPASALVKVRVAVTALP